MAEAEGIPPTASTASTGLSIRYVGNWAYAFSGIVEVTNTGADLLNFTTGGGLIVATWRPCRFDDDADNIQYFTFFNGLNVMGLINTHAESSDQSQNYKLLIPPFTHVQVTGDNKSSGTGHNVGMVMVGRVYDV